MTPPSTPPRRRGRPPLPPDQRKPRTSGKSGRPPPPSPEEVARCRALLDLLYPPTTWPDGPPVGAVAELARRVGTQRSTVAGVLDGRRRVRESTLAAWEATIQAGCGS